MQFPLRAEWRRRPAGAARLPGGGSCLSARRRRPAQRPRQPRPARASSAPDFATVTASSGSTASVPAGNGCPVSTQAGAGDNATGAYGPASATRSAGTAQPSRIAIGPEGQSAATVTSAARVAPTAAAGSRPFAGIGRATASSRANTSVSGANREMRCEASVGAHGPFSTRTGQVPVGAGKMADFAISTKWPRPT